VGIGKCYSGDAPNDVLDTDENVELSKKLLECWSSGLL
jgi:hypothetical protein